jgi:hypothetical protein
VALQAKPSGDKIANDLPCECLALVEAEKSLREEIFTTKVMGAVLDFFIVTKWLCQISS